MRQQQDGPSGVGAAAPAKSRDDVVLLRARPADEDVALGNAGVTEPLRHRDRRGRDVPGRDAGVDLDQLFIDLARGLLIRVERALRVDRRPWLGGESRREGYDGGDNRREARDSPSDSHSLSVDREGRLGRRHEPNVSAVAADRQSTRNAIEIRTTRLHAHHLLHGGAMLFARAYAISWPRCSCRSPAMMNELSMIVRSPPNIFLTPVIAAGSSPSIDCFMYANPSLRCFCASAFVDFDSNALKASGPRGMTGDLAAP